MNAKKASQEKGLAQKKKKLRPMKRQKKKSMKRHFHLSPAEKVWLRYESEKQKQF